MNDIKQFDHKPETRRRGKQLESAIFQATWDELSAVGYSRLTMEGVAERAETSKTVIYRRWSNRAELVLATIRQRLPTPSDEIPDTGKLRNDLLILLSRMNRSLKEVGFETIHGLMVDLGDIPFSRLFFPNGRSSNTMNTILKRAAERGEVQLAKITPRIATLPVDLTRHELLLSQEPVSENTLIEIVDDIFLPLISV